VAVDLCEQTSLVNHYGGDILIDRWEIAQNLQRHLAFEALVPCPEYLPKDATAYFGANVQVPPGRQSDLNRRIWFGWRRSIDLNEIRKDAQLLNETAIVGSGGARFNAGPIHIYTVGDCVQQRRKPVIVNGRFGADAGVPPIRARQTRLGPVVP
jgi:hypothetical protein